MPSQKDSDKLNEPKLLEDIRDAKVPPQSEVGVEGRYEETTRRPSETLTSSSSSGVKLMSSSEEKQLEGETIRIGEEVAIMEFCDLADPK